MDIYEPSDDSYLLIESLKKTLKNNKKDIKIIEIGSGSGIISEFCKDQGFFNLTVTDLNKNALKLLKSKGFKVIESDLFDKINEKFDLIIFNPPYLPFDNDEPASSRLSTTGGKLGNEIILRFLTESRDHLKDNGNIILLFSSLSKPRIILNHSKKQGFKYKKINEKKLFFEKIYVYLIFQ
jgi:release factor glutamine methyltransferase